MLEPSHSSCLPNDRGRATEVMDTALSEALKRGNPVVFFDVAIGGAPVGRMRLELFKKDCPKTVENFRSRLFALAAAGEFHCDWTRVADCCVDEWLCV